MVGVVTVLCLWSCLLSVGLEDTPPTSRHVVDTVEATPLLLTGSHHLLPHHHQRRRSAAADVVAEGVLRHESAAEAEEVFVVAAGERQGQGQVEYRSPSRSSADDDDDDDVRQQQQQLPAAVMMTGDDVIPRGRRRIQEIKLGEMDGLGRLEALDEITWADLSLRLTGERLTGETTGPSGGIDTVSGGIDTAVYNSRGGETLHDVVGRGAGDGGKNSDTEKKNTNTQEEEKEEEEEISSDVVEKLSRRQGEEGSFHRPEVPINDLSSPRGSNTGNEQQQQQQQQQLRHQRQKGPRSALSPQRHISGYPPRRSSRDKNTTGARKTEPETHENDTGSVIDKLPARREMSRSPGGAVVAHVHNAGEGENFRIDVARGQNHRKSSFVYDTSFDKSIDDETTLLDNNNNNNNNNNKRRDELFYSSRDTSSTNRRHNNNNNLVVAGERYSSSRQQREQQQQQQKSSKSPSANPKANTGTNAVNSPTNIAGHKSNYVGAGSDTAELRTGGGEMNVRNDRNDRSEPGAIDHLYVVDLPPHVSSSDSSFSSSISSSSSTRRLDGTNNGSDKRSDLSRSRFQNKSNTSTLAAPGHQSAHSSLERGESQNKSHEFEKMTEEGVEEGAEDLVVVEMDYYNSQKVVTSQQKDTNNTRFPESFADVKFNGRRRRWDNDGRRRWDNDGFDVFSYNVTASDGLSAWRDVPDTRPRG